MAVHSLSSTPAATPQPDAPRPLLSEPPRPPGPAPAAFAIEVPLGAARFAARAEQVLLAAAQVAAPGAIPSLPAWQQLLHDGNAARHLDALTRRFIAQADARHAAVAAGIGVTGGLSIGYVIWLVRGGVLVSSMLSALPAWQLVDPLPVVANARRGRAAVPAGTDEDDEDAPLEALFDAPPLKPDAIAADNPEDDVGSIPPSPAPRPLPPAPPPHSR